VKIFLIAGARPNFMKIAPIYRASKKYKNVDCRIVHTGQHYDQDRENTERPITVELGSVGWQGSREDMGSNMLISPSPQSPPVEGGGGKQSSFFFDSCHKL